MWTWTIPRLYIIFHGICEYSCASPTLTRAGFRFTPPSGVLSLCFGGTFLLFSSGYSRIFVLPSELQNHLQTLSMEQTPLIFVGVALPSWMRLKTIDFFTMLSSPSWKGEFFASLCLCVLREFLVFTLWVFHIFC